MQPSEPTATGAHPAANQFVRRPFPVLVVDDNEAERRLTAYHLDRAWPFERDLAVLQAADGREALAQLRRVRFALMLLDWSMPAMNGGEVLAELRRLGLRVPVVVVSGVERDQLPADFEQLGAAFLTKDNMNPDTLREAIRQSLQLLGFTKPQRG